MPRAKRTPVADLNQHITCKLCKGYYVDATTIIECLHSFCRSCIVRYLQTNKYCPVCEIQVHKTKPLLNIRSDRILQDLVYKIVPKLFQNEFQRRRDFLQTHQESRATFDRFVDSYQHLAPSDESISVTLSYHGNQDTCRYLRCPSGVSIGHLQKLIRAKYGLTESDYHIDVLYNQEHLLNPALSLTDVGYIYKWKRKSPMQLTYRIYEKTFKRPKLTEGVSKICNNNSWKEVQLRISENGEMSITGIQDGPLEVVNNNNNNKVTVETSTATPPQQQQQPQVTVETSSQSVTVTTATPAKTVYSKIDKKCNLTSQPPPVLPQQPPQQNKKRKLTNDNNGESKDGASDRKQSKPTILNLCSDLLINRQQKMKSNDNRTTKSPCYMPKAANVINVPKPGPSLTSSSPVKVTAAPPVKVTASSVKVTAAAPVKVTAVITTGSVTSVATTKPLPNLNAIHSSPVKSVKSKPNHHSPMGYKTLRDPPKSWNSQISRANLSSGKSQTMTSTVNALTDAGKSGDPKSVRPAKFFKMRNNMPRYLGNPASGVKPMYQVHDSPEKEKKKNAHSSVSVTAVSGGGGAAIAPILTVVASGSAKSELIKKHSIVKVDPKTLKPISERAPDNNSLMTSCTTSSSSDLKINTSSVSIFNPLKLQSGSPKGERKSPKSPHSPKIKSGVSTTTTAPSVTSSKRDSKLNLNFTPSNPFVPMNPSQFLFPAPPFAPYDPRMMAAYHNFLYGQRMTFPLGLETVAPPLPAATNHRSKFADLAPPSGATCNNNLKQQQHSPQAPAKFAGSDQSHRNNFNSPGSNKNQLSPSLTAQQLKGNKSDKSLQNAVEKLTQQQNKANREVLRKNKEEERKNNNLKKDKEKDEVNRKAPSIETSSTSSTSTSSTSSTTTVTSSSSTSSSSSPSTVSEVIVIVEDEMESEKMATDESKSEVDLSKSQPAPSVDVTVTSSAAPSVTTFTTSLATTAPSSDVVVVATVTSKEELMEKSESPVTSTATDAVVTAISTVAVTVTAAVTTTSCSFILPAKSTEEKDENREKQSNLDKVDTKEKKKSDENDGKVVESVEKSDVSDGDGKMAN